MSAKLDAATSLGVPILDEAALFLALLQNMPNTTAPTGDNDAGRTDDDGLTELSSLDFDSESLWPELVLYAGLLLRSYSSFYDAYGTTEYNNRQAQMALPFFFENNKKAGYAYLDAGKPWPSVSLPDVCGSCFRSFGLTIEGRYRLSCSSCYGEHSRIAYDRLVAMHRLCPYSTTNETILLQLIYKYYSSNGDPLWEMIKTTPVFL